MKDSINKIEIFTDGSCLGNPGVGGWAALIRFVQGRRYKEKRIQGGEANTTNNRMEIKAAIEAFKFLTEIRMPKSIPIEITSDSILLINTVTQGWKNLLLSGSG